MNIAQLLDWATDKNRFQTIEDYSNFCEQYLHFKEEGLQAVIISQNENNYCFFQYEADANFNVSRPVNQNLLISKEDFETEKNEFMHALRNIRDIRTDPICRELINKFIYTCQQMIGVTLDALPAGESNKARKINGDLFERYIRIILRYIGIPVRDGVIRVPIVVDNEELFQMTYQHDIIIEENNLLKAIGSVKTSSKDRIDKIFIDKFLYNRITESNPAHFAIFLNDVQRRGREPDFGVNTTFLTGHFKGYTVKLNPLDGVYYCDLRPIMREDSFLSSHIHPIDVLLTEDIWHFIE